AAPWYGGGFGGTSFATPAWAALIAVADQGRASVALDSLDGATQTLPLIYQMPGSAFRDITTGNNGFAAGAGYDLVTGRGSPLAGPVVTYLQPSTPAVASWASGRLDVFYRGANSHLWHRWYAGAWAGPEDLGGVMT